jgi:hypothetical protein
LGGYRIVDLAVLEAFKNLAPGCRQLVIVFGLALFARILYAVFLIEDDNPYFAETVSFIDGKGSLYGRIKRDIFEGHLIQQLSVFFMIFGIAFSILQFTETWRLFRVDPRLSSILLLIIIYFMLVTGPIMSPKYRLPTEPLLIIFCATAMLRRWLTWNRERQKIHLNPVMFSSSLQPHEVPSNGIR